MAVYSRCDRIFGPTRGELPIRASDKGCSLYAYDVRRRRERRLAAPSRAAGSEILPSLSRGRLVFARVAPARATPRLPLLISARLGDYRERRLPRPSGWASPVVLGDNLGPVAIDVAGDRAALGWRYNAPRNACAGESQAGTAAVSEVWLYDLVAARHRRVAGDCHATIDTPTGFGFTSPGLAGSALRYAFYSGPESRVRLAEVDLATPR